MTNDDRSLERAARSWLDDGPEQAPDRAVDAALARIQTTRQERDPLIPWRLTSMNRTSQFAAAAAAVVLVVGGGLLLLGRGNSGVGGPAVTPSPSPVAPSPSPIPSAAAATGPIAFQSSVFPVPLSLTLDHGWTLDGDYADQVDLQHGVTDLGIMQISQVRVPGATAADRYIPLPVDLVAWVGQRAEFGPVTSREVTVGGRKGTLIDADFTWDGTSGTDIIRYGTGAWLYDEGTSGQRGRFIVLPGAGDTGVLIFMEGYISTWDATAATLDQMLATLVFR